MSELPLTLEALKEHPNYVDFIALLVGVARDNNGESQRHNCRPRRAHLLDTLASICVSQPRKQCLSIVAVEPDDNTLEIHVAENGQARSTMPGHLQNIIKLLRGIHYTLLSNETPLEYPPTAWRIFANSAEQDSSGELSRYVHELELVVLQHSKRKLYHSFHKHLESFRTLSDVLWGSIPAPKDPAEEEHFKKHKMAEHLTSLQTEEAKGVDGLTKRDLYLETSRTLIERLELDCLTGMDTDNDAHRTELEDIAEAVGLLEGECTQHKFGDAESEGGMYLRRCSDFQYKSRTGKRLDVARWFLKIVALRRHCIQLVAAVTSNSLKMFLEKDITIVPLPPPPPVKVSLTMKVHVVRNLFDKLGWRPRDEKQATEVMRVFWRMLLNRCRVSRNPPGVSNFTDYRWASSDLAVVLGQWIKDFEDFPYSDELIVTINIDERVHGPAALAADIQIQGKQAVGQLIGSSNLLCTGCSCLLDVLSTDPLYGGPYCGRESNNQMTPWVCPTLRGDAVNQGARARLSASFEDKLLANIKRLEEDVRRASRESQSTDLDDERPHGITYGGRKKVLALKAQWERARREREAS